MRIGQRLGLAISGLKMAFSRDFRKAAHGLVAAASQHSPQPPSELPELIKAYNKMPWLRANAHKIGSSMAALQWTVKAAKSPAGKYIQARELQGLPFEHRAAAFAKLADAGQLDVLEDHPLALALAMPNPSFVGVSLRTLRAIYMELAGESFEMIDRSTQNRNPLTNRGVPKWFWPVPPHWVKDIPTADKPFFRVSFGRIQVDVPMTEMLWRRNLDPVNPYGRGSGTALTLADELDTDENAAKLSNWQFYNRGRPDLLVSMPGMETDDLKAFGDNWKANLLGVSNTFKTHFVNQDIKTEKLGQDFVNMQLVDLRRFARDTIRQVWGIPPELLGILENSNRSTIDAADFIFNTHVIVPRADQERQFIQQHIVPEYDARLLVDYVSPIQENKTLALATAKAAPYVLRVDEWRARMGAEPLGEKDGGQLFVVQKGLRTVEDLSELEKGEPLQLTPGEPPAPPGNPEPKPKKPSTPPASESSRRTEEERQEARKAGQATPKGPCGSSSTTQPGTRRTSGVTLIAGRLPSLEGLDPIFAKRMRKRRDEWDRVEAVVFKPAMKEFTGAYRAMMAQVFRVIGNEIKSGKRKLDLSGQKRKGRKLHSTYLSIYKAAKSDAETHMPQAPAKAAPVVPVDAAEESFVLSLSSGSRLGRVFDTMERRLQALIDGAVDGMLDDAAIAALLDGEMESILDDAAYLELVSSTEVGATVSGARDFTIRRRGFKNAEWIDMHDTRVRPTHQIYGASGVHKMGFNYATLTGGRYKLRRPHDPAAPPEEVINCRCILVPVV